ncbi:MAG: tetratricopeptide repeat protein [Deltaproteobacteria bacterium]|nr:MAG: tetratricopeptide repeat protein [Deltaproteobacteria bacterium]
MNKLFSRERLIALALISVIAATAYSNSFNVDYHLDDIHQISENYKIRDLSKIGDVLFFNKARPVLNLTLGLNYYFGQYELFGYHLVNLILHILNSFLVFFIIRVTISDFLDKNWKVSRRPDDIALLSSCVFTAHPIQTEAVTYIISRSSVLCTTFYLSAILLFIRAWADSERSETEIKTVRLRRIAFSILCFLLALGTKEIAVTFPVVLIGYDFCFISKGDMKKIGQRILKYHSMFLLIILVFFLLRQHFFGSFGNPKYIRSVTSNLATQIHVIVNYIRLLIVPINLNVDPDFPVSASFFELPVVLSAIILLGFVVVVLRIFRSSPAISFSIFWFFLTLSPTSSIVALEDPVAEHRLYLASVGFCLIAGKVLFEVISRVKRKYPSNQAWLIVTTGFISVGLLYCIGTLNRNVVWEDEITLWKDAVRRSPNKDRPHNNLGHVYFVRGQLAQAEKEFRRALEINPDNQDAHNNLGAIYDRQNKYDLAAQEFREALKWYNIYNYKIHYNLGNVYSKKGLIPEAIEQYLKCLKLYPYFAHAHMGLGSIYFRQKKKEKALCHLLMVEKSDPNYYKAKVVNQMIERLEKSGVKVTTLEGPLCEEQVK